MLSGSRYLSLTLTTTFTLCSLISPSNSRVWNESLTREPRNGNAEVSSASLDRGSQETFSRWHVSQSDLMFAGSEHDVNEENQTESKTSVTSGTERNTALTVSSSWQKSLTDGVNVENSANSIRVGPTAQSPNEQDDSTSSSPIADAYVTPAENWPTGLNASKTVAVDQYPLLYSAAFPSSISSVVLLSNKSSLSAIVSAAKSTDAAVDAAAVAKAAAADDAVDGSRISSMAIYAASNQFSQAESTAAADNVFELLMKDETAYKAPPPPPTAAAATATAIVGRQRDAHVRVDSRLRKEIVAGSSIAESPTQIEDSIAPKVTGDRRPSIANLEEKRHEPDGLFANGNRQVVTEVETLRRKWRRRRREPDAEITTDGATTMAVLNNDDRLPKATADGQLVNVDKQLTPITANPSDPLPHNPIDSPPLPAFLPPPTKDAPSVEYVTGDTVTAAGETPVAASVAAVAVPVVGLSYRSRGSSGLPAAVVGPVALFDPIHSGGASRRGGVGGGGVRWLPMSSVSTAATTTRSAADDDSDVSGQAAWSGLNYDVGGHFDSNAGSKQTTETPDFIRQQAINSHDSVTTESVSSATAAATAVNNPNSTVDLEEFGNAGDQNSREVGRKNVTETTTFYADGLAHDSRADLSAIAATESVGASFGTTNVDITVAVGVYKDLPVAEDQAKHIANHTTSETTVGGLSMGNSLLLEYKYNGCYKLGQDSTEYEWYALASHGQLQQQQQQSMNQFKMTVRVVNNYTIGLIFTILTLWSTVNVCLFIAARRLEVVRLGCLSHAGVRWSALASSGVVVILSCSRAVCFLVDGAAVAAEATATWQHRAVASLFCRLLYEVSWPCLSTAVVAVTADVASNRHRQTRYQEINYVRKLTATSPIDKYSTEQIDGGCLPKTVQVYCIVTISLMLSFHFLLTVAISTLIELCYISPFWISAFRSLFIIILATALLFLCCLRLRCGRCNSYSRSTPFPDYRDRLDPMSRDSSSYSSCYSSAFLIVVMVYLPLVVAETVVMVLRVSLLHLLPWSSDVIWWFLVAMQSALRLHEMIICVMLCLISLPSRSVAKTHASRLSDLPLKCSFSAPATQTLRPTDCLVENALATVDNKQLYRKASTVLERKILTTESNHFGTGRGGANGCRFSFPPSALSAKCQVGSVSMTASPLKRTRSMLYNDNGFIRFRMECDPETEADSDARTLDPDDDDDIEILEKEHKDTTSNGSDSKVGVKSPAAETYGSVATISGSTQTVNRNLHRLRRSSRHRVSWMRRLDRSSTMTLSPSLPSLFSFRAPSVDLQGSVERELDRCDIWRAALIGADDRMTASEQSQLPQIGVGVDERILEMIKLYAELKI